MGQYFKFINKTNNKESEVALPFNFDLPWAKSLEYDSTEELRKKFDYVIEHNQWDENDAVQAVGDYGTTFDYPKERY